MSSIEMHAATDVGVKRKHNEDCVGITPELGFAVLADGMGGHNAGEVASAMAVETILNEVRGGLNLDQPQVETADSPYSPESNIVRDAIVLANEAIFQAAEKQPQYHGMGTTVVVLLFYNDRLTVAHLGDSRLYRLRAGHLEKMTTDHSLVQELEDLGYYASEPQARNSIPKNYVTRAMGVAETPEVEVAEAAVQPDDLYLICSDGLSDLVSDGEIAPCLQAYEDDLDEAARQLIAKANSAGGNDNISIVLARVKEPFPDVGKMSWFRRILHQFKS